jgi:predicted DNA-binding transcriptional regulator
VYYGIEANKAFNEESQQKRSCRDPRKRAKRVASSLSRIGWLEYLVLEYAIRYAERFTPSDVVVCARSKYGLRINNRRVYDAIQRLLKQGFLAKIDRGWYELIDRNLALRDLEVVAGKAKQRLLTKATKQHGGKESEWGFRERVRDPVARIHLSSGSAGGLADLHFKLAFMHAVSGEALKCVEREGRGVLSGHLIRRNKRLARELAGKVVGCVVGAHSRYGGGRGRRLVPLAVLEGRSFREVGVDLILDTAEAPKLFAKIYTDKSPYKVRR